MTLEQRIADHALRIVLEEEIAAKWSFRNWYRTTARGLFEGRWDDLAVDNDREIRRLVRHLRRVRAR
jgi:hypothetical protein